MDLSREEMDRFIENNLLNFSINGSGWHNLIRNMLEEFCLAGWNLNEKVSGKEKFGGLRCYSTSTDEELNIEIRKIVDKYSALSGKTCEICGEEAKGRYVDGWEATLCFKHYSESIYFIEIRNNDIEINDKIIGNLNDINKAETDNSFRGIRIYFSGQEKYYGFHCRQPNYYLLLRSIALHLFSEEDQKYIKSLFENLNDCEVCGHKSLSESHCLRCFNDPWKNSFLEDYESKSQYIKHCQMDLFIDEDDNEKVFQHDRSFEKLPDHKILFNDNELREYEKDMYD
ncbi:hypothetical protein SAMN05443633_104213 [Chryseobacterium arachidis]|uniref:Uncharacterized protein n=1 Tax=Chryseobacterium arachidis TaxID=1416778 RepID=A0A1M5BLW3_9FLAO|nr:hypothetical protein [Chryseobacterium arachidis]SHF43380.1 hypothetical protein SAMN05443633_104213 [Chryseobacterium arachidis]